MTESVSRRCLIVSASLGGLCAAAVVADGSKSAAAFTVQPMDAYTHALYKDRCGDPEAIAYHRRLIAEVREGLRGQMSMAELDTTIASLTCPICGCPFAGLI